MLVTIGAQSIKNRTRGHLSIARNLIGASGCPVDSQVWENCI